MMFRRCTAARNLSSYVIFPLKNIPSLKEKTLNYVSPIESRKKQLQLVLLLVKAASSVLPSSHIQLLSTETHMYLGKTISVS